MASVHLCLAHAWTSGAGCLALQASELPPKRSQVLGQAAASPRLGEGPLDRPAAVRDREPFGILRFLPEPVPQLRTGAAAVRERPAGRA